MPADAAAAIAIVDVGMVSVELVVKKIVSENAVAPVVVFP